MDEITENAMAPAAVDTGVAAPEKTEDFVVVLAYSSAGEELPEEFIELTTSIKGLFTFKPNMRMYAVLDEAAANVLAQVEGKKEVRSND